MVKRQRAPRSRRRLWQTGLATGMLAAGGGSAFLVTTYAGAANAEWATWVNPKVATRVTTTAPKAATGEAAASRASTPPAALPHASMPLAATPTVQELFLIRFALLTLQAANASGNYSVLRELATPEFRSRNTEADLAVAFQPLRRPGFDLEPAAVLAPTLTTPAHRDEKGRLRLAGVVPSHPEPVRFDLTFEPTEGQWRLAGISVWRTSAAPNAP